MAQEVETIRPEAVVRGSDGYLRVNYDLLGLRMQTGRLGGLRRNDSDHRFSARH